MNTFILIVGNPRTSKSYCAMKIAEEIEKIKGNKFDVEKQLTLSDVKKFLTWSQSAVKSIFILDETGTTLAPDLFWSLQQRIMRRFVQTQGFRQNVLIWVLPSIIFIQKGFRFMSNYAIKTLSQGTVEVNKIVVDQLKGKGYPDRIETMRFGLPSEETLTKYKLMKEEWNDKELINDIDFLNQIEKGYEKILPKETILKLLKNREIEKDFAMSELKKLGYNDFKSDLILRSINRNAEEKTAAMPTSQKLPPKPVEFTSIIKEVDDTTNNL